MHDARSLMTIHECNADCRKDAVDKMKQVSQNILELGQLGLHRLTPTQRRKLSLLIEWEVLGK